MKRVGLEEQLTKKTGKYSRGMRQRLGLADVLIKNPGKNIAEGANLYKQRVEMLIGNSNAGNNW